MSQFSPESITNLVDDYGLNTEGVKTDLIVAAWLEQYEAAWIIKAIVEAVFRGRYQLKSVDGILKQWQRLGKPRCSFKPDFERERLKKIATPESSEPPTDRNSTLSKQLKPKSSVTRSSPTLDYRTLDPEELEPFHHHHRCGETFQPVCQQHVSVSNSIDLSRTDPQTAQPAETNQDHPKSTVRHTSPPRWWLLDRLKIAIGGKEQNGTTTNLTKVEADRAQNPIDLNLVGRHPEPEEQPKIPSTFRQS